jgi:putative MATE family efflux protein
MSDSVTTTSKKQRTDYTQGNLWVAILTMGLPSMLGYLGQHVYALIDMFWVSRLPQGENAVAAITFYNNMMFVFFSINSLIGPGSVAVISRRYGEKEYDKTEKAIKETIVLKLIFGAIFSVLGLLFMRRSLAALGATGETAELAAEFGTIMIAGMPILFATYSLFTSMRGVANPHSAMVLMLSSVVLNLVLDPILMFGKFGLPAMGIRGAAIASVTSFTLAFVIGLWLFFRDKMNVRLHARGRDPMSLDSMWTLIRIGVPAWIGEMSFSLSRLMIMPIIAQFGTAVVSAYGVGNQLFGLGYAVITGIGLGLSSLIGHTVGGEKQERAKETADKAVIFGVAVMAVFGLIFFVCARPILGIFFSDPEAIAQGVVYIRILSISMPFFGAFMMLGSIHTGVGLNMPVMVLLVIHAWFLQVLPAFVLTKLFGFGPVGVWWVIALSGIVSSLATYVYYRRGRWLTHRV